MRLQNICNKGRFIVTFERLENGKLLINTDNNFYPYYYELDSNGDTKTYDNKLARKVTLATPNEISKVRSNTSYESDVLYTKRYLIDKIKHFEKTPIKYLFIDIEILCKDLPDIHKATEPISCVTIYNSFTQKYETWYLGDWGVNREAQMLDAVVSYIATEAPDMILAWNIDFDYTYMYNRISNFAKNISPINETRWGREECLYPAGISIVDYKGLYEKLTLNKKRSYALDYIAQEDLGETAWKNTKFGILEADVKNKNINDVKRMVKLEDKFKVISQFDEIRRYTRCLWEDLPCEHTRREGKLQTVSNNSKIIDLKFLQEAKNMGIVLPKKPLDEEKDEFEGAFRESYKCGSFFNVGKYDLSGAYLYAIIDFCLDSSNIVPNIEKDTIPVKVTDRKTQEVVAVYNVKQNKKALLPVVIENLVNEKNKYKELLKNTDPNSPEYDNIDQTYKAVKGIVLSAWGVLANQYFRLYDHRVASMITATVRDLLHYVHDEVENFGFKVLYVDTDSVFCEDQGKNISDVLNQIVNKWAMSRFGKPCSITFDYEGHFEKILILTKCRYLGYVKGKKGIKKEIKGIEAKKSSSSKFEAYFQETLIDKVLNKESKDNIVSWIKAEMENIKHSDKLVVSFPAKIKNEKYEKNIPIFVRAYENSKELFKDFEVNRGELFYYSFVRPIGQDKNGTPRNVIAFTPDFNVFDKSKIPIQIDWEEMSRRNIIGKAEEIFEVMNWGNINGLLIGQTTLF